MLKKMMASMIQNWYWTIIHASYSLLREVDCSCTSEESHITPAVLRMNIHQNPGISQSVFVIPTFVWQHSQVHRKFSPVLRHAPKLITTLPLYSFFRYQRSLLLLYLSSEIPVTLKASRNTLLGSDRLLKLMPLSLHSTSSQTLLQSSRD